MTENVVRSIRTAAGLTQQQLADAAGTSQPTVAAYETGRKSPTFRTITHLAESAKVHVDVRCLPLLTREDRRSLALHTAIAERLQQDPERILTAARLSLQRMYALHPYARPLLAEWRLLLRRPLSSLIAVLLDAAPYARELRHVTPFTGVLSARERTEVYRQFAAQDTTERAAHTSRQET